MAPYLRYKESLQSCPYGWRLQGAMTREVRLFNKNVAPREPVKVCMGCEICPVLGPQTPFQTTFLQAKSLTKKLGKGS